MKHPLTSKERRGLVAVAAAALLCIASGFIFRNCSSRNTPSSQQIVVVDNDSVSPAGVGFRDSLSNGSISGDSLSRRSYTRKSRVKKSETQNGKRSRREKRRKAEKTYPTRSPLDEPCD